MSKSRRKFNGSLTIIFFFVTFFATITNAEESEKEFSVIHNGTSIKIHKNIVQYKKEYIKAILNPDKVILIEHETTDTEETIDIFSYREIILVKIGVIYKKDENHVSLVKKMILVKNVPRYYPYFILICTYLCIFWMFYNMIDKKR